jgi:ATP-dependent Clp protease ATP-binding subunit ClpC
MFERFTDRARRVVVLAQEEARLLNHNYLGTEHLLLGLVREGEGEGEGAQALQLMGITPESVRQQVEEIVGRGHQAPSGHIPFTPRSKRVCQLSLREALQLGHNYIGTEHLLLGLIREGQGVANPLLIGEHGVGTSTVVRGVAETIVSGLTQPKLAGSRLRDLELAMRLRNRLPQPPDETLKLLEEMRGARGTIFFVGGAWEPSLPGHLGPVCAAGLLRPVLVSGEIQVIATATPAEQEEWSAIDSELYNLFTPVPIAELSEETSAQILVETKDRIESRRNVVITDAAITAAVTLSAERILDQRLPGKAIDLMEKAAGRAARRAAARPRDLPKRIADLQARKDAAIDAGDYQRAVWHRDQERELLAQLEAWKGELKNDPSYRLNAVTAEDVAQALAEPNMP